VALKPSNSLQALNDTMAALYENRGAGKASSAFLFASTG
jgi:hypothetical protein